MLPSCPEPEEMAAEVRHHHLTDMATAERAEAVAEVDQQAGSRYQHRSWQKTLSAGTELFSNTVRYAIYTTTRNIRRPFGKAGVVIIPSPQR